ncbi:MAG TPA: dTDP-4-dehydrorhamnose reductase [Candidatus Magasanikbacteria bacterium]|nr:dTDP-4-dehydrorhamnose reductase [Candidatus Magasanikbacteria bacterium]HBX15998.1 dTDP-4-dehydrorhamnose reductase [Candidatus Magasanikbacteria bacterium]
MSVLILGVRGMLGQALAQEFSGAGYEMTSCDRAELDITDRVLVLEKIGALKPQIVINAAAYNSIDKAETEDRDLAFKINGEAVGYLVEAAARVGAFFVHYSTDYVFRGDRKDGYTEDDAPDPQSVYAKSKFEGEKKVIGQYLIRTSRLFGPAGIGDSVKKSFVDVMLKLGGEKKELDLVDEEVSSPTYVVDLARATRELIESSAPAGIYHCTNFGACTWYEWAKKIFELTKLNVKLNPVPANKFPRPAKRPKFSKLLNTKSPPLRKWEDALAEYLAPEKK